MDSSNVWNFVLQVVIFSPGGVHPSPEATVHKYNLLTIIIRYGSWNLRRFDLGNIEYYFQSSKFKLELYKTIPEGWFLSFYFHFHVCHLKMGYLQRYVFYKKVLIFILKNYCTARERVKSIKSNGSI
jgi:hypothetical protein